MPYIEPNKRPNLDSAIMVLASIIESETPEDLNYVITKLIHTLFELDGLNYKTLNAAIGVLECAKQELYSQIIKPYEDKKKLENGGISSLDAKTLEDIRWWKN